MMNRLIGEFELMCHLNWKYGLNKDIRFVLDGFELSKYSLNNFYFSDNGRRPIIELDEEDVKYFISKYMPDNKDFILKQINDFKTKEDKNGQE